MDSWNSSLIILAFLVIHINLMPIINYYWFLDNFDFGW